MTTGAPADALQRRRFGDDHSYFDPWSETLPRSDIERLQELRLLQLLPVAYQRAPLIRSLWDAADIHPSQIKSLADFKSRAPYTDKEMIRAFRDRHRDPNGGIFIAESRDIVAISSTSGTTGEPTPMPQGMATAADIDLLRGYWQIGGRPGDYTLNMMFTFRGGMLHAYQIAAAGYTPIVLAHDAAEIPRLIEASKRYRPTVLMMLSSLMLIALEQYFERSGDDPRDVFRSYKGAYFGGEPLSPRFKELVASWGLELFELTTLGDVCSAVQCRVHDGMHAWEDLALVENLDDDGRPVPDGEIGELVVTSLTDRHAPMIRFRTEDLVRMDHGPCVCGRTHARFWPLGRKGDQILVEGRSILPRDIQPLVEAERATRACLFQIVRPKRELNELRLRVGYESSALQSSTSALAARLTERLTVALQVAVAVELIPNEELLKLGPPHKIPRVTKT